MTPAGAAVTLPEVLDIQAIEPLRASLLAARGQPLTIDAARVERLGGLCLQLLLSAQRTWAEDGQPLALVSASAAFTEQWTAFGAPGIPCETHGELV
jgi:chemotaxis protein CheX